MKINKRALENADKIIEMFKSNKTTVEIAEELKLFRRDVRAILENNNIISKNQILNEMYSTGWYNENTEEFKKQFDNIKKLKAVNKMFKPTWKYSIEQYKEFLLKFYHDKAFNHFYSKYNKTKDFYMKPVITHIVALSDGGTNDLDNLECVTLFEQKIKSKITKHWQYYKKHITDYFL